MQIRIFTLPILGSEALQEELNSFLRARKILQVEKHLISENGGTFWCFCISWLDSTNSGEKEKTDYKKVLDESAFRRFSALREIRKRLAQEEALPAYAIFTDEELAGLAQLETLDPTNMKTVKGIGAKKIEKFGKYFISDQHAPGE